MIAPSLKLRRPSITGRAAALKAARSRPAKIQGAQAIMAGNCEGNAIIAAAPKVVSAENP